MSYLYKCTDFSYLMTLEVYRVQMCCRKTDMGFRSTGKGSGEEWTVERVEMWFREIDKRGKGVKRGECCVGIKCNYYKKKIFFSYIVANYKYYTLLSCSEVLIILSYRWSGTGTILIYIYINE